ncbi:MAG: DegT/DnrJ/EryC1/StrS family aminotransferase [Planctomycetota bacterium]
MSLAGTEMLAIDGGPKVRNTPFPGRRTFGDEEKQAVMALFDRASAQGPQVLGYNGPEEESYCAEFARFLGGGWADAVNSGTNALFIALRALGIEPSTEVIVPPVTDPGGVMPVALVNCIPVPADAAPGSYNVGADEIEARLTERTSAIIVAHISGLPADMDPIMELARARRIPVIEDCAQAHGARYKGRAVGSIGGVGIFSTMWSKHHASGGQGGAVFTRDGDLYWRIRRHADRGKPFGIEKPEGNVVAALNCNMDELHAAIARVQLRNLPERLARRRRLASAIETACRERLRTVRALTPATDCEGAYWFLFLALDLPSLRVDKTTFAKSVQAEGIDAGSSYLCIPTRMPWFTAGRVFGREDAPPWSDPLCKGDAPRWLALPNVEATDARHFPVFLHEDWTDAEIDDLLVALVKVERAYLK